MGNRAKRPKQSDWIRHDGPGAPVEPDVLVGDCDMGRDGIFRGNPIAASAIYWPGVRRYRLVIA